MAVFGFFAVIAFGLAQFIAACAGITEHLGVFGAAGILMASLFFRFTLPVTIGAFFGAMDVWGFPWSIAALFAAPGLIFLVPSVAISMLRLKKY